MVLAKDTTLCWAAPRRRRTWPGERQTTNFAWCPGLPALLRSSGDWSGLEEMRPREPGRISMGQRERA